MSRTIARFFSRPGRPRTRLESRPGCESLEERSLQSLSVLSFLNPGAPPVNPATTAPVTMQSNGRMEALYQLSLTRHPLYQSIRGSHVLKAPMFYASYTGPKRTDLDVIGANVRVSPGHEAMLTGKVLGTIDTAEPADYAFLINRGGASSPGPIPDRPGITYDAVVSVTTGLGGTSGTVTLFNSSGQPQSVIALATGAVHIVGGSVIVTVPESALPASSLSAAHSGIASYRYAFIGEIPGGSFHDIAGLVPEFASIPM